MIYDYGDKYVPRMKRRTLNQIFKRFGQIMFLEILI